MLINHYAGSPKLGMEYRPYYMAKIWSDMGHIVTIIAASQSHVRSVQPEISNKITNQEIDGIVYYWVKTPEYKGNSFGRIQNMFIFVWTLFFKARFFVRQLKPDIVIASSTYPIDIFPAQRIAKIAKAKLIYEVHDLWPLSPIELGGYSKWHPFIVLMQYAENYAYKKVDVVVSMLPCSKEHMLSHGLKENKFHHIPNGINLDEWRESNEKPPEKYTELIENLKNSGKTIIGYAGAHGIANSLSTLIEAAYLLKDMNIAIVLVGHGPEKINLQQQAAKLSLENVFFSPAVPKNCMKIVLEGWDLAFLGLQNQSLFRFGISPNKLMDYMLARKPIICAINSGNDPVTDAMCGITVEPENPSAIVSAIKKLVALSPEMLLQMGENGYNYVLKHHDYDMLAKEFAAILEN